MSDEQESQENSNADSPFGARDEDGIAGVDYTDEEEGRMLVDRSYADNLDRFIPQNVATYVPQDEELVEMIGQINHSEEINQPPRFHVFGPTGCAKTLLAHYLADYFDAPLFTVQGHYNPSKSAIIGAPTAIGNDVWWQDGSVTKAIVSSTKRLTFLLLDEINRVRSEAKGLLYDALDKRAKVQINSRGGEVIRGNPYNLVVIATSNMGNAYKVQDIDAAESKRLGSHIELDYVGKSDVEREVEILAENSPVEEGMAKLFVYLANHIRALAQDRDHTAIDFGIPTASLDRMSKTAWCHEQAEVQDPIMRAVEKDIIGPFYEGNSRAKESVETTFQNVVADYPLDEQGFLDRAGHGTMDEFIDRFPQIIDDYRGDEYIQDN